jgi:hypothetical protein
VTLLNQSIEFSEIKDLLNEKDSSSHPKSIKVMLLLHANLDFHLEFLCNSLQFDVSILVLIPLILLQCYEKRWTQGADFLIDIV